MLGGGWEGEGAPLLLLLPPSPANTKKALWFEEQGRSEEALKIWDKLIEFGQVRGPCLIITYPQRNIVVMASGDIFG